MFYMFLRCVSIFGVFYAFLDWHDWVFYTSLIAYLMEWFFTYLSPLSDRKLKNKILLVNFVIPAIASFLFAPWQHTLLIVILLLQVYNLISTVWLFGRFMTGVKKVPDETAVPQQGVSATQQIQNQQSAITPQTFGNALIHHMYGDEEYFKDNMRRILNVLGLQGIDLDQFPLHREFIYLRGFAIDLATNITLGANSREKNAILDAFHQLWESMATQYDVDRITLTIFKNRVPQYGQIIRTDNNPNEGVAKAFARFCNDNAEILHLDIKFDNNPDVIRHLAILFDNELKRVIQILNANMGKLVLT